MCKLGGVLSVCEAQVVSHELVSQSNLKAYNFCGKAQNRLANQQETRTWISFVFENSRVLLFPTFVSFHRFLIRFQFSFTHIDKSCFSCFPLKFCAGNQRAAGQNWSPRACPTCRHCVSLTQPLSHEITSPRDEERRNWERFWVARRLTNCREWRTIKTPLVRFVIFPRIHPVNSRRLTGTVW